MKNRYLPFGYKIADGKIVADSEQVEAVRRIFADYTAGQNFNRLPMRCLPKASPTVRMHLAGTKTW